MSSNESTLSKFRKESGLRQDSESDVQFRLTPGIIRQLLARVQTIAKITSYISTT